jgi:hypothetical protein
MPMKVHNFLGTAAQKSVQRIQTAISRKILFSMDFRWLLCSRPIGMEPALGCFLIPLAITTCRDMKGGRRVGYSETIRKSERFFDNPNHSRHLALNHETKRLIVAGYLTALNLVFFVSVFLVVRRLRRRRFGSATGRHAARSENRKSRRESIMERLREWTFPKLPMV